MPGESPAGALRPGIPPKLAAILRQMTAHRPEDRYENCAKVAKALKDFTGGHDLVALCAGEVAVAARGGRKRRAWERGFAAVVISGMALALIGGALSLSGILARPRPAAPAEPGELVVEASVAGVRVQVSEGDTLVSHLTLKGGQTRLSLPPGEYRVALEAGSPRTFGIEPGKVTLAGGKAAIVTLQSEPFIIPPGRAPAAVREWKEPDKKPGDGKVRRFVENQHYVMETNVVRSGWYSPQFGEFTDGILEVKARMAKDTLGGRWAFHVWNARTTIGARIFVFADGRIQIGPPRTPMSTDPDAGPAWFEKVHPAVLPQGQWNTLRIVLDGPALWVFINGEPVQGPIVMARSFTPVHLVSGRGRTRTKRPGTRRVRVGCILADDSPGASQGGEAEAPT